MPRYIGYRPQFEPISLQEYLTVPTMVVNDYKEAEKEFNEYQDKVAAIEALAGNNEKAKNIITQYRTYLGDAGDNLTNGVRNAEGFRAANKARDYYRNSVMKLEPAIASYQNAQKIRASKDDGTIIGPELSLDSFIDNPLYEDRFVLGSSIQAEAMKAAAVASDRRKQETEDRLIRGGQNYSYYELTGFNPEEQQAYYLKSDAVPELKQLEDSITDKYVQQGYSDADARRYAKLGIIEGITYDRKRHDAENEVWKQNAKFNTWKREQEYTQEQKRRQDAQDFSDFLSQDRGTVAQYGNKEQQKAYDKISSSVTISDSNGNSHTINGFQAYQQLKDYERRISEFEEYETLMQNIVQKQEDYNLAKANADNVRGDINNQDIANKKLMQANLALNKAKQERNNWVEKHSDNLDINFNDKRNFYSKESKVRHNPGYTKLIREYEDFKKKTKDVRISDKDLKTLEIDATQPWENISKEIGSITGRRVLYNIDATNAAGEKLAADITGSLNRTLKGNKGYNTIIETLDGRPIQLYSSGLKNFNETGSLKNKNSLLAKDGDNYIVEAYHVSPESIRRRSLVVQSKNNIASDNNFNAGYVKADLFGTQVIDAFNQLFTNYNINPEDDAAINAFVDRVESQGLTNLICNMLSALIAKEYNYNFHQMQGNTQKED